MVFSSSVFLFLFLPLVLMLYWSPFMRGRTRRNVLLFAASIAFYAWGEPVCVGLLLVSILVTWIAARCAAPGRAHARAAAAIGVGYHLCVLFTFKYLGFAARELGALLGTEIAIDAPALPIGISFFTFQLISCIIDVERGDAPPPSGPLAVGLYAAFFPQLIAGPIVRFKDIAKQIDHRSESFDQLALGVHRFCIGLGKKVLLANYLALGADAIFDSFAIDGASVAGAWLGAISYTLQIYFDFSGYSDMAIGAGLMFGFRFRENFDQPYRARSLTEFWRRWHISLSAWFRDYVYIPLGGGRGGATRRALVLFTVWLLTGAWHGAEWTFIVWGLMHFAVLSFERAAGLADPSGRSFAASAACRAYTLTAVLLAWVVFRSPDLTFAVKYIGCLFGAGATALIDDGAASLAGSLGSVLAVSITICALPRPARSGPAASAAAFVIFALSLLQIVGSQYDPFIYFNF